jgi:hypothetical protein
MRPPISLIRLLLALTWTGTVLAADVAPSVNVEARVSAQVPISDSKQLEEDLQHLPWEQFRAVVEAVPKMKADVELYGPLGWQIVQANYRTYAWRKSIDKLDSAQKQGLIGLIQAVKGAK